MSLSREARIRMLLEEAFHPLELSIRDQSHLHLGHPGAKDGKGHFDLTIVAQVFENKGRVQRHKMVYDALGNLLETDIHALRIEAFAPTER